MTATSFILWSASFLWAYALILAFAWFAAVRRDALETHVGHFISLMGIMVPPAAASILIVLVAGGFGLAWLAPVLILTVPGGLVISFQLEVSRMAPETSLSTELARLGAALALTLAFSSRA